MKILIFGNGQMGNFYKEYLGGEITKTDITDLESVRSVINAVRPDVVINTGAKTNLEWCENNKKETYKVNVEGAKNLADVCEDLGIYFVHLSSGCIFQSVDANDAKKEDSETDPACFYSHTKVWAERLIMRNRSPEFKALILRPRQPVSSRVDRKNMLVKFLTFTQFVDTPNTGTVIEDLMDWTAQLMEKRYHGIVHVANEGWSTPFEIAKLLKEHVLPSLPIEKISKEELDSKTPNKRVDTVLDVSLLKSLVKEVRPYGEALEDTIKNLAKSIQEATPVKIKEELENTAKVTAQRATPNSVWEELI